MTAVNLDLAVSLVQLATSPTIAFGLQSSSYPSWSEPPFSKIIEGSSPPGFYAANSPAKKLFGEQNAWERWTVENKAVLVAGGITCWHKLRDRPSQEKDAHPETPTPLATVSETVVLGYAKVWSSSTGPALDSAQTPTVVGAWQVSILATSRDATSRLRTERAKHDDWIMVLSELPFSGSTTSLVPGSDVRNFVISEPDRRPPMGTSNSSSTISSVITDPASSTSRSSNRRIEIKSGVPSSIRAVSEGIQVALPADGSTKVKTAWTFTAELGGPDHPHEASSMSSGHELTNDSYPNDGKTNAQPRVAEETTDSAKTNGDQPVSEETTIWDDFSVAPVNPADLVNLAIHSPVGLVLATPELRLYWVNERWYQITKVQRGQDLNSWIDGIHPESLPILMNVLQGLMASKEKRAGDIRWKDDAWSTFTAQVLLDPEGNVTAVAATIDDCTQRKRLELAQLENLKVQEAAARYAADQAIARAKELADWHSQRRVLERRTRQFAQMAEISPIGLSFATKDGEIIWGMSL